MNPKYITEILSTSSEHQLRGLKPASEAFFGKKVLFVLHGREWMDLRKLMKASLTNASLKLAEIDISIVAAKMVNVLTPYANAKKGARNQIATIVRPFLLFFYMLGFPFSLSFFFAEINMLQLINMYHMSAIGKVAFDYDFECLENFDKGMNGFNKAFEYMLTELPRRAFSLDPAIQNDYDSPNEDNRLFKEASDTARNLIEDVIQKRLDEEKAGLTPRNDLLNAMIRSYMEEYGNNDASIKDKLKGTLGDNLIEIVFAGYNTSTVVIANALYFLAKHPEWLQKVQKEVDGIVDKGPILWTQAEAMKNIERVILESLRLCPPACLMARETMKDHDFDGIQIPIKTEVWLPAGALHMDPASWEEPHKFNPDRFLKTPIRGSYIPFGDGIRNCIGRFFAMHESICAVATIVRDFNLTVPADYNWNPIFTGFGLRPFCKNRKKVCLQLVVSRRE